MPSWGRHGEIAAKYLDIYIRYRCSCNTSTNITCLMNLHDLQCILNPTSCRQIEMHSSSLEMELDFYCFMLKVGKNPTSKLAQNKPIPFGTMALLRSVMALVAFMGTPPRTPPSNVARPNDDISSRTAVTWVAHDLSICLRHLKKK